MDDQLSIDNLSKAISLELLNAAPDCVTVKQVKELAGAMCCAASEYCSDNSIANDIFAV